MTDSTYADTEALRTQTRAASILASLNTADGSRVDVYNAMTLDQCADVIRWAEAGNREPAPSMAGVGALFARMFGGEVRA
jgi:hypothetical protein